MNICCQMNKIMKMFIIIFNELFNKNCTENKKWGRCDVAIDFKKIWV